MKYTYTKDDFFTEEPYKLLCRIKKDDPFKHALALAAIKENARAVGVSGFNAIYDAYVRREKSCRENT